MWSTSAINDWVMGYKKFNWWQLFAPNVRCVLISGFFHGDISRDYFISSYSIFAASIGEPHLCAYNTESPSPNPIDRTMLCPSPTNNILDLILTSLAGQFQDTHSPHKLSDHDIVSVTLKIIIPPIKKPRRKVIVRSERWLWIYVEECT